jgi:hypothetical protein
MTYDDAYRYGAYFAGSGGHGNGSYFAYGNNAISETRLYADRRIYAAVRPDDLKIIDKSDLQAMLDKDWADVDARMAAITDHNSPEYKKLKQLRKVYYDQGQYAAMKGYDAINVPEGNSNYGSNSIPKDNKMKKRGYFVLLNRSAAIVSDTPFEDRHDIFNQDFRPGTFEPAVVQPAPPVVENADAPADAVDAPADAAGEALAPAAAPGVV